MRAVASALRRLVALGRCAVLALVVLALPAGAWGAPPTLSDLWAGTAHWEPYTRITLADSAPYPLLAAGTDIVIAGSTWYLFDRTLHVSGGCGVYGAYGLGTEVRAS